MCAYKTSSLSFHSARVFRISQKVRSMKRAREISPPIIEAAWHALCFQESPDKLLISSQEDLKSFSKVYETFRQIARIPSNKRKEDLMLEILQEAKFSKSVSTKMLNMAMSKSALDCDLKLVQIRPKAPSIIDVNWRMNVIISSSHLSRALQPFVELTLLLSNGKKLTIEMNLQKFHLLRYTVSRILRDIQLLETRQALQH